VESTRILWGLFLLFLLLFLLLLLSLLFLSACLVGECHQKKKKKTQTPPPPGGGGADSTVHALTGVQHSGWDMQQREQRQPGEEAAIEKGAAMQLARKEGSGWVEVGIQGQQATAAEWARRAADARTTVSPLWLQYADAFAAHWRHPATGDDARQAMLLASLQQLLASPDDGDDARQHQDNDDASEDDGNDDAASEGMEDTLVAAVVAGACPELIDLGRLLSQPDHLFSLLAEPFRAPLATGSDTLPSPPAEEGNLPVSSDDAKVALRDARTWCLLQFGFNMLLLYINTSEVDASGSNVA